MTKIKPIHLILFAAIILIFIFATQEKKNQVVTQDLASAEHLCAGMANGGQIYILNVTRDNVTTVSYCIATAPSDCNAGNWAFYKTCGNLTIDCVPSTMTCSDGTTLSQFTANGNPYLCNATGDWNKYETCTGSEECIRVDATHCVCHSKPANSTAPTPTPTPTPTATSTPPPTSSSTNWTFPIIIGVLILIFLIVGTQIGTRIWGKFKK